MQVVGVNVAARTARPFRNGAVELPSTCPNAWFSITTTTTCAGCGIPDTRAELEPDLDAADDAGEDDLAAAVVELGVVEAPGCFELLQPTRTNAMRRQTLGAIIRMGQACRALAAGVSPLHRHHRTIPRHRRERGVSTLAMRLTGRKTRTDAWVRPAPQVRSCRGAGAFTLNGGCSRRQRLPRRHEVSEGMRRQGVHKTRPANILTKVPLTSRRRPGNSRPVDWGARLGYTVSGLFPPVHRPDRAQSGLVLRRRQRRPLRRARHPCGQPRRAHSCCGSWAPAFALLTV